jgi:phenylalanyl-tRNA synthetase beta chain
MTFSYNWLKEYINTNIEPAEMAKILTAIGLEVESMETFQTVKGGLAGFVIGEVKTCEKHPDADKLSITTVDIGMSALLNIVCGAPNVGAGQKVVVATEGTTVYMGNESFKIKKSKLRGQFSEGMICAEDELGLGTAHDGIMVLDPSARVGMPAKLYFKIEDDVVFEIGLTPNRVDAASHYGVARDLYAFLRQEGNVELKLPSVDAFKTDNDNYHVDVVIENTNACPRYAGLTVSNIKVDPSPEWLKNRLLSLGMKPINNVVDITNFILHELGQPLHAFDADKIKGKKIVVKNVAEGTKFKTLDDVERSLSSEDLLICNTLEPMALAGVFGGIESGVTENTTTIFIESAYFNPVSVRKTAKRHGLNTDASFLFERGTDPNIPIYALKRAALLVKELAGGTISSEIVDVYPNPVKNFEFEVFFSHVDRLIGKKLGAANIVNILKSLQIGILEQTPEKIKVSVPPFRVDVQREADIIEDVLRIYGYNNIEISDKVNSTINIAKKPDPAKIINIISDYLVSNSFNEIMSNSLTKSVYYEKLETYKRENVVSIMNPLSTDLNGLRQTLLFGGLEAIAYNTNRKNKDLKLFEYGNCYSHRPAANISYPLKNYKEDQRLGIFITGQKWEANWAAKEEPTSFYFLKTYVENILSRLGISVESLGSTEKHSDIFDEALCYESNHSQLVEFGMVSRKLLKSFDIKADVYFAEFSWDNVFKLLKNHKITYTELPKFPEVRRDLALLLDKSIHYGQIKKIAHQTERKLLKKISLFDVYEGEKIGADKKSYAVSFILQDETKTLTDSQIDKIMTNLENAFTKELAAQIRK